MRFPDARKRQNDSLQEFLEGSHVSYSCLDQIVEATDHHMAFDDFRCLRNSFRKAVENVRRGVIEPYLNKDNGTTADFRGFEHSPDSSDKALTEKALDAL